MLSQSQTQEPHTSDKIAKAWFDTVNCREAMEVVMQARGCNEIWRKMDEAHLAMSRSAVLVNGSAAPGHGSVAVVSYGKATTPFLHICSS